MPASVTMSKIEESAVNEQVLPRYVLITPARNEEAFIEKTIESVIHQTHLPLKWVIINDGSTDSTASRIEPYLAKYDWIELVNLPVRRERNFAAKVNAFNKGQELVKRPRLRDDRQSGLGRVFGP